MSVAEIALVIVAVWAAFILLLVLVLLLAVVALIFHEQTLRFSYRVRLWYARLLIRKRMNELTWRKRNGLYDRPSNRPKPPKDRH